MENNNPFTTINEQLAAINQRLDKQPAGHVSEWLNVTQAAEYLNLSKSAIYKRTMNGKIPFYKTGKKLMFRRSELNDYISMGRAKGESFPGVTIEK